MAVLRKSSIVFATLIILIVSCTLGSRRKGHVVKVLSTNTRLGFVDLQKIVESQKGKNVLDSTVVPDNIYHGSVQAYGDVYDFILDKGVVVTKADKYFKDNDPIWIDSTFVTYKSKKEFLDWLKKEQEQNFTLTSYRLADNNCLTFVHDAVKFLGGEEPKKLWTTRQFALNNRKNLEVLQALYRAWKPQPEIPESN